MQLRRTVASPKPEDELVGVEDLDDPVVLVHRQEDLNPESFFHAACIVPQEHSPASAHAILSP